MEIAGNFAKELGHFFGRAKPHLRAGAREGGYFEEA
jgi:hypothetical protein